MIKKVKIKIYGRVQGVWFRESAKEKALELSLSGWVRNESDGSVSAEAEGEEEDIDKYILWCKKGPEMARVDRVEVEENGDLKTYKDFVVRY